MSGIGIDIGSTYTKLCVLGENGQLEALFAEETPVRQKEYFAEKLQSLREAYGDLPVVSCGYGRKNIDGSRAVSELSALAAGVHRVAPKAETVLDIGGQDTKLIRQREGKLLSFFVNDKCAAGCGMFLENTLHRLNVPFESLDLSDGRLPALRLSSTCAVFAQSEIVERIAEGVPEKEILRAVLVQILTQSKTLLGKVECERIWLSGGLTKIPGIAKYAEAVLEEVKPDVVLVHGDTSTTFVTALACFYLQIPVGHVEAGLRTYNIYSPYPEEFNRQAVSIISRYNFAPTELSKQNLLREGKDAKTIYVTGNTAIDALKTTVREDYTHPELEWAKGSRLILITAHRRENLGEPMRHMFRAIRHVMDKHPDVKAIYPIHMNPVVRETADAILGGDERIHIIEPLDVLDFHNFMARSYMILTDSGGIQEEAPSLGKPVLVMRDTTERPEGIKAGTLKLVGTDEETIYAEFSRLLRDKAAYDAMAKASNPYGDGHACERIARIIIEE